MGPGTADPHVVPPAHRQLVTRGANLVLAGGVVAGTWTRKAGTLTVAWFGEAAHPITTCSGTRPRAWPRSSAPSST